MIQKHVVTTSTPINGNNIILEGDSRLTDQRTPIDATVGPGKLASLVPFLLVIGVSAGPGGSADDYNLGSGDLNTGVSIGDFQIIDAFFQVDVGVALATVRVRSTTGGGGDAYTSALIAATNSLRSRETGLTLNGPIVNGSNTLYLRRSDSGVSGTLVLTCNRLFS